MKTIAELQAELKNEAMLHGERHASTARLHNELGTAYYSLGEFDNAQKSYQLAWEIAKEVLGEDDEFVIDTHYRIGRVFEARAVTESQTQEPKMHMQENLLMRKQYDAVSHMHDPPPKIKTSMDDMDSTLIYNDTAEEARLSGDLDRALPLYMKSIELRRIKFGDNSPALIPVFINYAELLRQKNQAEAAKAVLDEAMAIAIGAFGKDHVLTAEIMNNLGMVYRQMGDLDKAQALLMEALRLRRGLLGDLDIAVGATLNNLAELLRERQDYQEAINYHNLAIEAFEKTGGADHPGTINAKGNLGITLRRYAKINMEHGEHLIKDTVDYLNARDYNEQHPWVVKFGIENVINEAQKLSEQGKFEQSLDLYDSLLKKKEMLNAIRPSSPSKSEAVEPFSPASPATRARLDQAAQDLILICRGKFNSMLGKGRVLLQRGRYLEVDKVISECAEIPVERLGSVQEERDQLLVEMKMLRAENDLCKSNFEACVEQCVEVLQEKTDMYGPDSEHLTDVMIVLAECYRAQAQYDEAGSFLNQAMNLISEALRADEQALGKGGVAHVALHVRAVVCLAELERNKGAYSVAVPLLKEAADLCREHLLEDDPIMGELYTSMASIEKAKGDYLKATELLQQALEIRSKLFGKEHLKVASTHMHLADLLLQKGDLVEAEKLISRAVEIRSAALQEVDMMHPALVQTMCMRARLQQAHLQLADAQITITQALDGAMVKLGRKHPLVSTCMCIMADIMFDQHMLDDADNFFDQALSIGREVFSDHSSDHHAVALAALGVARVCIARGKFTQAQALLEDSIEHRSEVVHRLGGRFHSEIGGMNLQYGIVLLRRGRVKDAGREFGRAGVAFFNAFQDERNIRVADALQWSAEVNAELGKCRDAKYQLSLCMAIRYKHLGKNHPATLQTLHAASDVMRRVGYFHDATESCMALEVLVAERFGAGSVEAALAQKLHADIFRDRGKGIKAQELYEKALKVIGPVFGESSYIALEIRTGLARCLQLNRNLGNAERAYKEVLVLAEEMLGKENHFVMDIRNNIMTLKLFQKPKDSTRAVDTLKDTILAFYTANFPSGHSYIAHANGRIGMFMNSLKKESGGRFIRKALKYFDEMKQFPYTNDHPWVQELGGFQKASSQERLSQSVEEQALSEWSMPKFDGDLNYGTLPKQFWIDLSNNTAEVWGDVHYYGMGEAPAEDVLPIIAEARQRSTSPSSVKRRGKPASSPSRRASSSAKLPPSSPAAATASPAGLGSVSADIHDDEIAALLAAAVAEEGGGADGESGAAGMDPKAAALAAAQALQAKLLAAAQARRSIEDALHNEQHERKDLQELLEAEREAKVLADQQAVELQAEREELQRKYEESLRQIEELGLRVSVAEIKNDEGEDAEALFGSATQRPQKEGAAAAETASADANAEEAVKGKTAPSEAETGAASTKPAEGEETTKSTAELLLSNPLAAAAALKTSADIEAEREAARLAEEAALAAEARRKAELEAAQFLFSRATELQEAGWYVKALPLFEECLHVRTTYLPDDPITNETRRGLARNLMLLHRWDEAEDHAEACAVHMEKLHGFENVWLVESLIVQGENRMAKGVYADAATVLSRAVKLSGMLAEQDKAFNTVQGRALVRQAHCSLLLGKISEAKAMAERGTALLSKSMGINNIETVRGVHVKSEILLRCSKFKEALNLTEQTMAARKRTLGEIHPAVAESMLQMSIALVGVSNLPLALEKLDVALRLRLHFFGEHSLEAAETFHYKAKYAAIFCRYQEAMHYHRQALAIRTAKSWERYPGLSDSHQGMGDLYAQVAWFNKSAEHYDAAMQIRLMLPADPASFHPLIAETKCAQATMLRLKGDYEAAKPLLDESLDERRTLFGKENLEYLANQQEYALFLQDTGDLKNADKLTKRTIKLRRQAVGLEHPVYAESLQCQASILIDMGMVDEAQILVAEASQIHRIHFAQEDDFMLHLGVIRWKVLKAYVQLALLERRAADEEAAHAAHLEALRSGAIKEGTPSPAVLANSVQAKKSPTPPPTETEAETEAEAEPATTTAATGGVDPPLLVGDPEASIASATVEGAAPTTTDADANAGANQSGSAADPAGTSATVASPAPPSSGSIVPEPSATFTADSTEVIEGNSAEDPAAAAAATVGASATVGTDDGDDGTEDGSHRTADDTESVTRVPEQPQFNNDAFVVVYELLQESIHLLKKLYHEGLGGTPISFIETHQIGTSAVNATVTHGEGGGEGEGVEKATSPAAGTDDPSSAASVTDASSAATGTEVTKQEGEGEQKTALDAAATVAAATAAQGGLGEEKEEAERPPNPYEGLSPVPTLPQKLPRLPADPQNPLITFIQGRLGAAMLLEYLAKQRFAEALTPAQREIFNSQESMQRMESKEVKLKPSGVPEMEEAYRSLQTYPEMQSAHVWLQKLKTDISGVVFTLDDMEVAANNFIEAEALQRAGKYAEADATLEEVFLTQMTSLGVVQASTSMVVAETLFAKAENSRLMGDIELSKVLYNQSITIFRKQLGSDNEGVMKGIMGLTSLLYSQGLYDDALSLHSNVLLMYNKISGAESLLSVKARVRVGYDLMKLGRYEQALEMAQHAFKLITHLDAAEEKKKTAEDVADARLLLCYIYMYQGNFPAAREHLDKAQGLLEAKIVDGKQVSKDSLMITDVHICRAEFFFITGRCFDAQQLIAKALRQRVKLYGRSTSQSETGKSNERKMAFFEHFDNLTVEASKEQDSGEDGGGPKRVRREQDDVNDGDLDVEMNAAFDDVKSQFNDSAALISSGGGGGGGGDDATKVSSYIIFVKKKAPKAALVVKGVPLAAHPEIADCVALKGRISAFLGDFKDAKEMLEASQNMLSQLFARPSQKKLCMSHELAVLASTRGHFEDAKHFHNEVLQQRLQLCDEDHPDKADSLFQIARLSTLLSKYEDSTQLLSECMVIRKKVYGEGHWKVAEAIAECALVLHAKGFHADSNALYDKSMQVYKHCFGDLHYLISEALLGQAANARETGAFEQANAYIEQATAMRAIIIGDSHPDTAMCWYQQALVTRRLGRYLETKRLLDQAISCQREKLGKYHPYTAMTLLSLAFNFMDLAKYSTAGHVFNRAVQLIRKSFGKDHVLVADGLTGVGENLKLQAFYTTAKENHEKALYIRRKLLGERHHTLAESLYCIGEIHATLAQYEDAIKCFDDALALQRMALSQSHPDIATTMHGLANVMLAQGKLSDGKYTHDRAFTMRKACLSSDHPAIGHSQFCIASVFRRMGRLEQAAALFERCLNTVRDSIGSRHPIVGSIIYNSGEVANQMGRFHHAEALLLESLGIRLNVFKEINEDHPAIVESYFGLGENLRLRGLYEFQQDKKPLEELKRVKENREKMEAAAEKAGIASPNKSRHEDDLDEGGKGEGEGGGDNEGQKEHAAVETLLTGVEPADGKTDDGPGYALSASKGGGAAHTDADDAPLPPPAEAEGAEGGGHYTVRPPDVYDPTAENSDLISAPTVCISAVEKMERDNDGDDEDGGVDGEEENDDGELPAHAFDSRSLVEDPRKYKAIPMFNKVLDQLKETFPKEHPLVLQAQHALAEVLRALGKYDAALEMHEALLTERKKHLGEGHPDTLYSMLAMGETLRSMGKLYPESSAGSIEAKRARIGKQAMSLGVTLLDHFNSLVQPCAAMPEARPFTSAAAARMGTPLVTSRAPTTSGGKEGGRPSTRGVQEAPWIFLSKKDEKEKKKKPLKIPRGYMGYEFPAEKRFIRKEGADITRPQRTRTGDAKWMLDAAAQHTKRIFGEQSDTPLMAALMFAKGDLLRARGDNAPALQLYEQSLIMRRKIFRGTHPVIADCINAMAEIFRIDNKFKQALPMYDKALEIRTEAYDGEHPSIAEVKNNIAMLHFAQGNFEEAQRCFEESLTVCEQLLGASHPATAIALNNLAGLLHSAQLHKQALPLYQRALAIKKATFGDEHADVASTMNNIGLLYKSIGKYPESQDMYEKALEVEKKLHGDMHKDIATTMNNLAALYVLQNKRYEAKELYKDSIAMRSALFGREHPTVASTLNNYAGLLYTIGEYESAKDFFQDALRIRRKVLGEEHPAVAETLNNIGLLLYKQGMLKEAMPLYEKCLDIKVRTFGEVSAPVASSVNNLAGVFHKLGHFDHACSLYQRAHTIRKVVLGEAHPDTKAMLQNIAAVERDRKKWASVLAVHEHAAKKDKGAAQQQQQQQGSTGSEYGLDMAASQPGSQPGTPQRQSSGRGRSGRLELAQEDSQLSFDENRSFA